MLTPGDLKAIRRIVHDEIQALLSDGADHGPSPVNNGESDEAVREDVQQAIAWMRREWPDSDEYAAARTAWRRGEPGSEKRWHAVRLAHAKDELKWARANRYTRYIQRAERMIARLEREIPKPYIYRPRKQR
jgi:hypothetical protein